MNLTVDIVVAIANALVAGGAIHAASLTRRDRNYWPMLRVMWAAIAFVYGGSAFNLLTVRAAGTPPSPVVRLAFSGVALAAIGYSVWFMRRRNRLARFVGLTVGGDIVVRSVAELEAAATLVESWAAHGAMPEARAARLEAALAEWRAKKAWARATATEARARRAAKERGGIPDVNK
jgi:hypothetical protein